MAGFSHFDKRGKARMVDVTAKAVTARSASAHAFVKMSPRVVAAVRKLENPKGDPLEVARIAGISAAKRTSEWIPLCHPLPLSHIDVHVCLCKNGVEIHSQVTTAAQTGVEMEALVAAAAAALTVYDMCKALDKGIEIGEVFLVEKTGGKSGDYHRVENHARSTKIGSSRKARKGRGRGTKGL
ncbi:MAG TPA: cyclic pyranopterin monophosphate synthase MoaC [Candidatus Acidoferrum sp.]